MANLENARKAAVDFLKKTLNPKDIKVIKAEKVEEGWDIDAEVYEESSFIKALGLPTKVQDRNIYAVELNDKLEIEGYERKKEQVEPGE